MTAEVLGIGDLRGRSFTDCGMTLSCEHRGIILSREHEVSGMTLVVLLAAANQRGL